MIYSRRSIFNRDTAGGGGGINIGATDKPYLLTSDPSGLSSVAIAQDTVSDVINARYIREEIELYNLNEVSIGDANAIGTYICAIRPLNGIGPSAEFTVGRASVDDTPTLSHYSATAYSDTELILRWEPNQPLRISKTSARCDGRYTVYYMAN